MLTHLFSPLNIGPVTVKNRIFSTGHQTMMCANGLPTDRMIAYQAAKARGGAGLIITESSRPHKTALQHGLFMDMTTNTCIPQLTRMAEAIHEHGAKVFGQLGHSGALAVRMIDGIRRTSFSASTMFDQRYKNVARPLDQDMIADIIEGYRLSALLYIEAGYDGVEIMANHGVLPSQFLNPRLNQRTDQYGGNGENRMRFLVEILQTLRDGLPATKALGVRFSLDEREEGGLVPEETIPVCEALAARDLVDYFNVTGGTMQTCASAINVTPPMSYDVSHLESDSGALRARVNKPVFYAGRINQPQQAEELLRSGALDMAGMTRAMIADPNMARKAEQGRVDDIIACIACNQACIGHLHNGVPVSCIQSPETGRELELAAIPDPERSKRVLIVGGGPAGMKAALSAAGRGHQVVLCEAGPRLGGAALLAQMLPGREEFGGLITNLEHQLHLAGVKLHLNSRIEAADVTGGAYDAVILATGATAHMPDGETFESAQMVHVNQVLEGTVNVGARVVIFDWRGDWPALGLSEMLAREGCYVRLVSEDPAIGQLMQTYVRDTWLGRCHKLGVEFIHNACLFGAQDDSVYFMHSQSREPIILEDVDTLILSTGSVPDIQLEEELKQTGIELHLVGDCLSPRSAEEAIYEGWQAGLKL